MTDAASAREHPGSAAPGSAHLAQILELEEVGEDRFVALPRIHPPRRKFGGETAGQAAVAAGRTVASDRVLHSAHVHFLRAGASAEATTYDVVRLRDGGSFSTRLVEARQAGRLVCQVAASFHEDEPGFAHQTERATAMLPETIPLVEDSLRDDPENLVWLRGMMARGGADFLFPELLNRSTVTKGGAAPPHQRLWMRSAEALPDEPIVHGAAMLYLSDYLLLAVAAMHHGLTAQDPRVDFATLDHTIWYHSATRADDWLLHQQHSPWAGQGRALSQGSIFDRHGTLVASVSQQGLLRRRSDRPQDSSSTTKGTR